MKISGAVVSVWALAVSGVLGCAGKLEVGEDSHAEPASKGESQSNAGGTGGDGSGDAGGTGGAGSAATTGTAMAEPSCGNAGVGAGPAVVQDGEWVDEITPTPAAPGSSEGCPMGPQYPDGACETEGLSCLYRWESLPGQAEYQQCYCTRSFGGGHAWQCFNGTNDPSCPIAEPEDGSDCYGFLDLGCSYPHEGECYCDASQQTWDCTDLYPEQEQPDPPEAVDPERLVADLTEAERESWCEWYSGLLAGGPGHAPIADRPVEDGCATGLACTWDERFCEAALPSLSVAQCVQNLSLSECESPVSNLSGCVIDMLDVQCGPFEYSCLYYLETAACDGTIILHTPDGGGGCSLRVE